MEFLPLDAPLLLHRNGAGKNKHGINFSLLALFSRNSERPPPRICLPITGAEEERGDRVLAKSVTLPPHLGFGIEISF